MSGLELLVVGWLVAFAAMSRLRILWGPPGAVLLTVGGIALGVLCWQNPQLHDQLLGADRGPATAFIAAVFVTVWWSLWETHSAKPHRRFAPRSVRWNGFSRTDWILGFGLVGLAILGAWLLPPSFARPGDPSSHHWSLAAMDAWGPSTRIWWILGFLAAAALPWFDVEEREHSEPRGRRREVGLAFFLWTGLYLVPTWAVAHGLLANHAAPTPSISLADRFWVAWLGMATPTSALWRELPGFLVLVAGLILVTVVFPRWRASRGLVRHYVKTLGARGYGLAAMVVLALGLLVLTLLGRWFFGWGPWLEFPEWGTVL